MVLPVKIEGSVFYGGDDGIVFFFFLVVFIFSCFVIWFSCQQMFVIEKVRGSEKVELN